MRNYSDDEIIAQVEGTDVYDVRIVLDGEDVIDMYCSCPYARDGHNCKHMAAVLFKFEEMLAEKDAEREDEDRIETDSSSPIADFYEKHQKEKAEVADLHGYRGGTGGWNSMQCGDSEDWLCLSGGPQCLLFFRSLAETV